MAKLLPIASERVSKPSDQGICAETIASERVSKPQDQGETAETVASKRVSKPQDEGGEAGAFIVVTSARNPSIQKRCQEP